MTKQEVAEAIKNEFVCLFPNSGTYTGKGCLGDDWGVTILLGNRTTHANGIELNDPLRSLYWVQEENGVFVVTGGCTLSSIKPSSPYMYCDSIRIPFRKKTGDTKKVIEGMKKHFEAIRKCVDENKENMLPNVQKIYADC